MPLFRVLMTFGDPALGLLARTSAPVVLVLLMLIALGIRIRREGLAVGAAVVLTVLMIQA